MQSWMGNASCQFTIREGTCTALTKLYVDSGLNTPSFQNVSTSWLRYLHLDRAQRR